MRWFKDGVFRRAIHTARLWHDKEGEEIICRVQELILEKEKAGVKG